MKPRAVTITLFTILAAMMLFMGLAIYNAERLKPSFTEDGFIIVYDEQDPSGQGKTYYFNAGTKYSKGYNDTISFKTTEGEEVSISASSFVHYNSGAVASMGDSVLMDLNEVDQNAVNYYGLTSKSTVEKNGKSYSIASGNGNIGLNEVLWKIGENRFMVVAEDIFVSFADGREYTYHDFVELYYYESGMLSIITEKETIKTASADCYITTGESFSINASTQTILVDDSVKMSLSQMVTDSDQNINILPPGQTEVEIRTPIFNFNVIHGENGENGINGANGATGQTGISGVNGLRGTDGEKGETGITGAEGEKGATGATGAAGAAGVSGASGVNGAEGVAGQDGFDGDEGQSGANGTSGTHGRTGATGTTGSSGANGSRGADGRNGSSGTAGSDASDIQVTSPTDTLAQLPSISVANLTITANSISGELAITNEQFIPSTGKIEMYLFETNTGSTVDTVTFFKSAATYDFSFTDLTPQNSYTLMVLSDYQVSGTNYNGIFYNKEIFTDVFSLGISTYSTSQEMICLEIKNIDGRSHTIGYTLTTSLGSLVCMGDMTLSTPASLTNSDGSTSDFVFFTTIDGTADPLYPNTTYYFSITSVDSVAQGIPAQYTNYAVQTLKRYPAVSGAECHVNLINNSFNFSVASVADVDNGIFRYRYEVYNTLNTDTPVKVIYSTSRDGVVCYLDGTQINAYDTYVLKVVAEFYDNYRNIELPTAFSTPFTMNSFTSYPYIEVVSGIADDEKYPDKFECGMKLHIPGNMSLNESKGIVLRYQNAYNVEKSISLSAVTGQLGADGDTVYQMNFTVDDMKKETTYIFSAYGSLDFDGQGNYISNSYLGNIVVKTADYCAVTGTAAPIANNTTNPIAFTAKIAIPSGMSDAGLGVNNYTYALSRAATATIKLYDGAIDNISFVSVDDLTFIQEITVPIAYNPATSTYITGPITEANLTTATTSSFTTGSYTALVTEIKDGTQYANSIPVNGVPMSTALTVTYPDTSTLSLSVTAITASNILSYISSMEYDAMHIADYDAGTVFGYAVQAGGLSSAISLFDKIEYYAYDSQYYATNLTALESSSFDFYPGTDPSVPGPDNHFMAKIIEPCASNTAPVAVFLFADMADPATCIDRVKSRNTANVPAANASAVDASVNTGMTRGRSYRFTFRLVTVQNAYYPENLGVSFRNVMKNTNTFHAPYESPSYYFYQKNSTTNSVTYGYYVKAMDTEAVGSLSVTSSAGSPTLSSTVITTNADAEVTISNITNKSIITLNTLQYPYISPYGQSTQISLPKRYFSKRATLNPASSSCYYEYEQESAQNRIRFTLVLPDEDLAQHVAGITANVTAAGGQTTTCPLEIASVTGNEITTYLKYSQIAALLNSSLTISIKAYCDTGVGKLTITNGRYYAIQEMGENSEGKYLALTSGTSGLIPVSSGYAMNSFFKLDGAYATATGVAHSSSSEYSDGFFRVSATSPLFSGYSSYAHSGIADKGGSKSQSISTSYVLFKELTAFNIRNKENGVFSDEIVIMFSQMTPQILMNDGMRVTIAATAERAEASWSLSGSQAATIFDNKVYFDLYKYEDNQYKPVAADNNYPANAVSNIRTFSTTISGDGNYMTVIDNLHVNTNYAIIAYYYASTADYNANPKVKTYLIDAYRPENPVQNNYFQFMTSDAVVISNMQAEYVSAGYQNKNIAVSYSLPNQTSGFDIIYALYKKTATPGVYELCWTHDQLNARMLLSNPVTIITSSMTANISFQPGSLSVNNVGDLMSVSDTKDYYLRIIPISQSRSAYTGTTPAEYETWIDAYNIGHDNYMCNLAIPDLERPFYNVKAIPGNKNVTFKIAVSDTDHMIVDGLYKVKIFDGSGNDITPASVRNVQYSIGNINKITVGGLGDNVPVTLKLYTTLDEENTGNVDSIASIAYDSLDDRVGANYMYLKSSVTGRSIPAGGYSVGDIEVIGLDQNKARIDFVNGYNIQAVRSMVVTIVNSASQAYTFVVSNPYTQFVDVSNDMDVNGNATRFGFNIGTRYTFDLLGEYTFNIRFVTDSSSMDTSATYYKAD